MSFGFGTGFGQNNNNQQPQTGFGGFGANNTTGTGFGASGSNTFGTPAANTAAPAGGMFGGASSGGFGAATGGFGASSGFGAKPAFGATNTTGGGTGLFGAATPAATTSNAGGFGGGFGATNTAGTGFGGATLFGAAKPATTGFGTTTTPFGGGAAGGGLFGGGGGAALGTAAPAFGATNNPGIGTNVGDPPGTAVVPFTPTVEKETNNPSQSNSFQNILFMEPYKKWSAEELRLADYNQGRKTGSPGGTGGFGNSGFGGTGFGTNTQANTGFGAGASTGGLFGSSQTTAVSGFGTTPATTTGFGANSGGLFGGTKPATGGLFNNSASQQQPAAQTGLFGGGGFGAANNTTTNAFGTNNNATAGGGLFGATPASQPKTGFSFGNTAGNAFGTTATPSTGFGATPATNTGTGLFGNTAQTNTGGGLFGAQQQQQQQPAATGGFGGTAFGTQTQQPAGGGLFGSQPKPAGGGLFGTAPTATGGSGLFGSTAQTSTPFGTTPAQQPAASGSLFGAKPAGTSGTGLFGSNTTAQAGTTGGGLFNLGGNTQNQQQQPQSTMFGGLGQNNQANKPLFGGQTSTTGTGMFGSQPAQQQSGLFSGSNQQPQTGGLGNSLFGNSQNQQQGQQNFSTSINDLSAYGSTTLFSNLPDNSIKDPGPLATSLSGQAKPKSRSILPMYKLSPANTARFGTPQKRGYGFSYSTYGSPSAPSSVNSTPGGFGQSLLLGSTNKLLSKSISASNLRRSYNVEDSILQPGAFSASSGPKFLGNGNAHKRLVINKDMRSDLFSSPIKDKQVQDVVNGHKLTKRVSFDTGTAGGGENASRDSPRESIETNSPTTNDLGYLKPTTRATANGVNGQVTANAASAASPPDMEQVKGNELTIVHEEDSPVQVRSVPKSDDPMEPGAYWMSPTAEEIYAMNRVQRQKVPNFIVGRENVGSIAFQTPVDLSGPNMDEVFGNIIILENRSATVYPNSAKKPPVGKGMNVPAIISLEHSQPRGGASVSSKRLERHINKLKADERTQFVSYDKETGVWSFRVEHFTTYGFDDDDEDEDETEMETAPLESTKPHQFQSPSDALMDTDSPSVDPDDTFDFKMSGRRGVPGAFEEGALFDEELSDIGQPQGMSSPDPNKADAPIPSREWPEDESMADGQDLYQHETFEQEFQHGSVDGQDDFTLSRSANNDSQVPGGIMRARMRAVKKSTAPTKIEVTGGDDWTQILQASVKAPRTMDRATLRALNESGAIWEMKDRGSPAPQQPTASDGTGFATSIDLMKSLFEQAKGPTPPAQTAPARGFVKWPYQKRAKVDAEDGVQVPRPTWGPNEVLLTTHHGETSIKPADDSLPITGTFTGMSKKLTQLQQYIDSTSNDDHGHQAREPDLRELAQGDPVWELASLLFDSNGSNLPAFWRQTVSEATNRALAQASTPEEKAIICLSGNRVADACGHLLESRNYRLANLVACIGTQSKDIRAQLKDWRDSNVLAEFSEPIRAIYELLAGNACVCAGVKNVPIENRVNSFTISQRFGLDWMQSFGLRLFYATGMPGGSTTANDVAKAVRAFRSDIEQERESEPNCPLWTLLKMFAAQEFDWLDQRLGWLLTKAIHATGSVSFGPDAAQKLDMASLSFASALTVQSYWVPATFVLLQLSDPHSREAAVRDHLGRHAHLIGSFKDPKSAFAALRGFGGRPVPESWIWEAKALDFRARQDARQEFLALVWAGNYKEANHAFVHRVGPDLVIERDFARLVRFAELLFKVRKSLPDWERAAAVYLLYPLALAERQQQQGDGAAASGPADRFDGQLLEGLVALRATTHGDVRQEAAIADMAEGLIKAKGGMVWIRGCTSCCRRICGLGT
ncbi:nuclear protein 96-domain-containing protein [Bombardia bombarda]|uniref:Nuclear protein 96-domain-containing protein n=1 Tax=Bombardia bombarda TaxID=252184 RepID=A0AA40C8K9_9PEZI|nr:nuclear protein 96-domain-containing protein [Bombardia bombarda]